MRIAHVSDVYLPRLGGVELQVHDLAAGQRMRGDDAFVLTTTPLGAGGDAGDVPVLRLGSATGTFGDNPYRRVGDRALAAALHASRAQLVHAHVSVFSPLAWQTARLAATNGLPTVVSVHSMWHDILPVMRPYMRWQRAAQWPVAWASVSTAAADAVREALDGTAVAVLPNGIDPTAWLLPDRRAANRVPRLVSVMRMVGRKRPLPLLNVLLAVHATHPGRFRAVLVGDGPLLPRLRRRLAAAGPACGIQLTGALDRAAIRGVLASADLYIAPALRESFGIAALEARSAGLPVLARTGSGIADFVRPGVEGWLAASDTDLATMIGNLLDDPPRLAAVARHNRAHPPRMHWAAVFDAADALYQVAIMRQRARTLNKVPEWS